MQGGDAATQQSRGGVAMELAVAREDGTVVDGGAALEFAAARSEPSRRLHGEAALSLTAVRPWSSRRHAMSRRGGCTGRRRCCGRRRVVADVVGRWEPADGGRREGVGEV